MRKISQSGLKKKCDKLWGKIIHKLYADCCLIQNGLESVHHAGRPEAHHLITRSCNATRHDPRNGVLLCSLHHKYSTKCSPHMAPLAFVDYIAAFRSDQKDWYNVHRFDKFVGSYDLVYDNLCKLDELIDIIGKDRILSMLFANPDDSFDKIIKDIEQFKKRYYEKD